MQGKINLKLPRRSSSSPLSSSNPPKLMKLPQFSRSLLFFYFIIIIFQYRRFVVGLGFHPQVGPVFFFLGKTQTLSMIMSLSGLRDGGTSDSDLQIARQHLL